MADFKSGVETIFVLKDNKQEYIEVDDFVRQGDYKYTYSDSSITALKSEQADMVVTAVERFAQAIPLNMEEIFIWYFEQKGVDNPERFLGVNDNQIENGKLKVENSENMGKISKNNMNPENQLSQIPSQNLSPQGQFDMNTLVLFLGILQKLLQEKGENTSDLEELVNSMEELLEEK